MKPWEYFFLNGTGWGWTMATGHMEHFGAFSHT